MTGGGLPSFLQHVTATAGASPKYETSLLLNYKWNNVDSPVGTTEETLDEDLVMRSDRFVHQRTGPDVADSLSIQLSVRNQIFISISTWICMNFINI